MRALAVPLTVVAVSIGTAVSAIGVAAVTAAGDAGMSPEVWVGLAVTLVIAALPTVVAWGKLTERLNSVKETQGKMVTTEGLGLALEKMKNEMLKELLKKGNSD